MDTNSRWRALKVALQKEAEVIFYATGEIVLVQPTVDSELELLMVSRTKHLKLTYVSERDAVRWEMPKEYGFEPLSGATAELTTTLIRLVHRR